MKKRVILAFGIFIAVGLLLIAVTKSPGSNAEASATQVKFIGCPPNLGASYGGKDGWSTIGVQAKYSFNAVAAGGILKCYYGYVGTPVMPFFEIQQPCPAGYTCETLGKSGNGFKLTPIR